MQKRPQRPLLSLKDNCKRNVKKKSTYSIHVSKLCCINLAFGLKGLCILGPLVDHGWCRPDVFQLIVEPLVTLGNKVAMWELLVQIVLFHWAILAKALSAHPFEGPFEGANLVPIVLCHERALLSAHIWDYFGNFPVSLLEPRWRYIFLLCLEANTVKDQKLKCA